MSTRVQVFEVVTAVNSVQCPAVWETQTGRCLRTLALGEAVARVAWTPAAGLSLVAAARGRRLLLLNPGAGVGAHRAAAATDRLLAEPPPAHDVLSECRPPPGTRPAPARHPPATRPHPPGTRPANTPVLHPPYCRPSLTHLSTISQQSLISTRLDLKRRLQIQTEMV